MYVYPTQTHAMPDISQYEIGDLVQTIIGEYGIIVAIGPHQIFFKDKSNYYKVLIDGHIYHYIAGSLKKINKKC